MFFDNIKEVPHIAEKVGCSIFVLPNYQTISIKNSIAIRPNTTDKAGISVDQIKEIIARNNLKQATSQFIIIYEAEKMNLHAANALLKSLEEPKENYHYILQTETPSSLLPTILSRAAVFVLRNQSSLDSPIEASEEIKTFARRLISAKITDYVPIMNDITKKKDNLREYVLTILKTAIEISYKSFFKTNNSQFLKKIPNFITAYENISANGHIKIHLVADML